MEDPTFPISISNLPFSFDLSLLVDILLENRIFASDLYKTSETQATIVFADINASKEASRKLHKKKVLGNEIFVDGLETLKLNEWDEEESTLLLEGLRSIGYSEIGLAPLFPNKTIGEISTKLVNENYRKPEQFKKFISTSSKNLPLMIKKDVIDIGAKYNIEMKIEVAEMIVKYYIMFGESEINEFFKFVSSRPVLPEGFFKSKNHKIIQSYSDNNIVNKNFFGFEKVVAGNNQKSLIECKLDLIDSKLIKNKQFFTDSIVDNGSFSNSETENVLPLQNVLIENGLPSKVLESIHEKPFENSTKNKSSAMLDFADSSSGLIELSMEKDKNNDIILKKDKEKSKDKDLLFPKESAMLLYKEKKLTAPFNSSKVKDQSNSSQLKKFMTAPFNSSKVKDQSNSSQLKKFIKPLFNCKLFDIVSKLNIIPCSNLINFNLSPLLTYYNCDVCGKNNHDDVTLDCIECGVFVHPKCYGLSNQINKNRWKCDKCVSSNKFVGCSLCFGLDGAFKETEYLKCGEFDENDFVPNSGWVHLICAQLIPGLRLKNNTTMYPIYGIELIDNRFFDKRLLCCFCTKTIGVIQCCSFENCKVLFHPRCALHNNCLITITSFNKSTVYCKNHAPFPKIPQSSKPFLSTSIFDVNPCIRSISISPPALDASKNINEKLNALKAESISCILPPNAVELAQDLNKSRSITPLSSINILPPKMENDFVELKTVTLGNYIPKHSYADFFPSQIPAFIPPTQEFISWRSKSAIKLPSNGLSFYFADRGVTLKCKEDFITFLSSPTNANLPINFHNEVWVNSKPECEFHKPFMKLIGNIKESFVLSLVLEESITMNEFDVYDYIIEKFVGQQMLLTNMCANEQFALFLYPNSMPHKPSLYSASTTIGYKALEKNSLHIFKFSCYLISIQVLWHYAARSFLNLSSSDINLANSFKIHVVLDIDKTLLFPINTEVATALHRTFSTTSIMSGRVELNILIRPGLFEFLNKLSRVFSFSLCTMGTLDYCNKVLHFFKRKFPEVNWNNCLESISADFTRFYSDKKNGYKDLKMIHTFSHFERWRNNIIIVDDTRDVWLPQYRKYVYNISEFTGPTLENACGMLQPNIMDDGLSKCWKTLSSVHSKFVTQLNQIDITRDASAVWTQIEQVSVSELLKLES